jgi:ubiquinone/menaquinone biosynthesis C-methylase UbiE
MDIKKNVREKYGEIAKKSQTGQNCGCNCGCGSDSIFGLEYSVFNEDYSKLEGYQPDADLSLGCGLPTEHAKISAGDTVVDLGSGAGNDCFVTRSIVGENGHVIGLDFTPEMIAKARANASKLGFINVDFVQGDIENMPFESELADVVVSNCVLNLVPDKQKAFSEIFRILKKGGHFCVSDIVLSGTLPERLKNDIVMYAGCVSGAILREEYLSIIEKAGFENIQVKKDRVIEIPDDIFKKYVTEEEVEQIKQTKTGIFSITVYAEKPGIVTLNNYNYSTE